MRYDERTIVKVAMLYYLKDLDQDEIALRLSISRQSVSRHLKRARDLGVVRFTIDSPEEVFFAGLELELETAFNLKAAVIAPVNLDSDDLVKDAIGRYAASYLEQNLRDGDVLAISWSTTVFACARQLRRDGAKNLTICQLNGSMDVADYSTRAEFIVSRIAEAFSAKTSSLPAPLIVDSAEILNSILADTRIKGSMETARCATVGLFGIGNARSGSSLRQAGYIDDAMIESLRAEGVVGEIAGHFFDIHGELRDGALEARTLAVPKSTFESMRCSIALAGGPNKLDAIEGALAGRWCNVLVTDEKSARSLLERRKARDGGLRQ
jgi:deoxyribonucleoside regulator